MVLGLISLAATVPMAATSVLNFQSQAENSKSHGVDAEWKTNKSHMRELFADSKVVLRNGRLYLPYPDSNFEGLVSTISDEPPQLNWIYLDTGLRVFQISHGLRAEAEGGLTDPWGARVCPDGEIRVLMENWEGFIAVETEEPGLWGLCFDRYDDGLK
ncbi:hypothetical protein EJ07DRAFT_166755 [Lizonia empirigonia]|nr:hypothetical protein EJ07DRAFT_166755 [Lizonia empirigonia]